MRWKNPITPQTPRVCGISLDAPIQSALPAAPRFQVPMGFIAVPYYSRQPKHRERPAWAALSIFPTPSFLKHTPRRCKFRLFA